MKKLLLAASMLVATAANAFAADMAVKARPMPVAEPAYDWSGFYIGGQLGGMWSQADSVFTLPPVATFSNSGSTGIGGGFVGAQFQWNRIVLGLEANVVGLFERDLGRDSCNPLAACAAGSTYGNRLDDVVWSVGPRLGLAAAKWMPYLTGGYAATKLTYTSYFATGVPATWLTQDRSGWYAGVGADWAVLPNVILGVEYRHYDFGTASGVPVGAGGPAIFDTQDVRLKSDTVTVRASYKFGGAGPVVAKY